MKLLQNKLQKFSVITISAMLSSLLALAQGASQNLPQKSTQNKTQQATQNPTQKTSQNNAQKTTQDSAKHYKKSRPKSIHHHSTKKPNPTYFPWSY